MNRNSLASEMLGLKTAAPGNDCDWIGLGRLAENSCNTFGIVAASAPMCRVLEAIRRFAPYREGVLIQGESGTGKELMARALHALGPAPDGPFVTFNCSNLMPSLAESQLFGHVRGAFTDARDDAPGYFRSASGGTLFLDEIGELPLELQPKLLRAVENHEVQPVGSSRSYRVEIRVVAATNRDLRAMMKRGTFRADLYYRLNSAVISIPPLRERRGDLPALAAHFISHYNELFGKRVEFLSRAALALVLGQEWPGNVREFSHAIQSAMMMTDSDRIDADGLPDCLGSAPGIETPEAEPARDPEAAGMSLNDVIDEASRRALARALREAGGNCHRAADLLGVSRYTVYRMLSRYHMAATRGRGHFLLESES